MVVQTTDRVDLVDALAAFIALSANPVTVQVIANAVQHFARKLIILPLLCVILQHHLAHQIFTVLTSHSIPPKYYSHNNNNNNNLDDIYNARKFSRSFATSIDKSHYLLAELSSN